MGDDPMKIALLATLVLCASAAFGQAAVSATLSAQPQVYSFDSHPGHAARMALAQESSINGGETYVVAQGERPLWEVATPVHEVPLGDSARELREQHLSAKKAIKSWQN
jgi:hypothetical protein